ncbi:MAG: hypothetical protein M0Z94_09700 [Dehalococcoidales bacterium]|nr:hypothetical protein [Dehalococcoidales bacterium]
MYWTTRDRWGVVEEGVYWDWAPAVGVTYNYEVRHTQLDTWGLYFNGTNVKSAVVGWETADDWGSGGETPNGNQGMGSSNNNNVQYLDPNGNWYSGAGYQVFNTRPDLYHVDAGANTSSWRVWGNN